MYKSELIYYHPKGKKIICDCIINKYRIVNELFYIYIFLQVTVFSILMFYKFVI